jgi:CRP/FNR family transcriptional regulator
MSNSDFLGRLDTAQREELLSYATPMKLRKGAFVFCASDPADAVFLLLAGRVKTYKISPSGREVILWFSFPGEVFGLVDALQHRERMVNVQTCEATEIAKVPGARFNEFLAAHPDIAQLCVRVVASRLGMLANRLVYLMADDAEARIAKLLLDLAARYHDRASGAAQPVRLTHQEIADITGVQRQTVTRILGRFTERGALTVRYRNILIRNRELLARYAARHP